MLRDRLRFWLETFVMRGPFFRLMVVAGLVGGVSLVAGLTMAVIGEADSPADAIWWAFLRLTDPGYLGDDVGFAARLISTLVTVSGYVLFMGALIAIMTQWFSDKMAALESGVTPASLSDHVVILGWGAGTPAIVAELLESRDRVRRFLSRRGGDAVRVHIAVLVDELDREVTRAIRDRLGDHFDPKDITIRAGSPLRLDHLDRIDYENASALLIPSFDAGVGSAKPDSRTIKTAMSLAAAVRSGRRVPVVVAELKDPRNVAALRLGLDAQVEVVCGPRTVSQLIAQSIRHPAMSPVYRELLTHTIGAELYVRDAPAYIGRTFGELTAGVVTAIPIGLVGPHGPDGAELRLCPDASERLREGDRIVVLASSFGDSTPPDPATVAIEVQATQNRVRHPEREHRRVLILGWSSRIPALIRELDRYSEVRFEADIVSVVPLEVRERELDDNDVAPVNVTVRQIVRDHSVTGRVAELNPASYDNVVCLSADWLDTEQDADARTIMGYLQLQQALAAVDDKPPVLVELADPDNETLFASDSEIIVSPLILSHLLAQTVLRPELALVFEELFGVGGAEIMLWQATDYGLEGQTTFRAIGERVRTYGEIALGVRRDGLVELRPNLDTPVNLTPDSELVILARTDSRS